VVVVHGREAWRGKAYGGIEVFDEGVESLGNVEPDVGDGVIRHPDHQREHAVLDDFLHALHFREDLR
jgi:hypothetical protein